MKRRESSYKDMEKGCGRGRRGPKIDVTIAVYREVKGADLDERA